MPKRRRSTEKSKKTIKLVCKEKGPHKLHKEEKMTKDEEIAMKEYLTKQKQYFDDVDNFRLTVTEEDKKSTVTSTTEDTSLMFDRPSIGTSINPLTRESISIIPKVDDFEKSEDSFIHRADINFIPPLKENDNLHEELKYITQK
ncbi:hypothetical protein EIN_086600 [Entamoeba invadens IP1]|uniref:hypothetical protein n=1 Tax=Entamoeba invadens IP1 TaxID=370355 RepID=UPI0002C3F58A|nr:hypothetical protein EIN_086600 [Entamoeba invadens IP1]ELP85378.1 hypothetical protein EIN_086600 [Entamoeba invadens IP1]|eukprot:XP_004184724.1 hypothetical protein EIN_086600 [Entamoeba invadens IP1]